MSLLQVKCKYVRQTQMLMLLQGERPANQIATSVQYRPQFYQSYVIQRTNSRFNGQRYRAEPYFNHYLIITNYQVSLKHATQHCLQLHFTSIGTKYVLRTMNVD